MKRRRDLRWRAHCVGIPPLDRLSLLAFSLELAPPVLFADPDAGYPYCLVTLTAWLPLLPGYPYCLVTLTAWLPLLPGTLLLVPLLSGYPYCLVTLTACSLIRLTQRNN
ncbi:hypothetical protein NHX12_006991 [Muraenolepis orangiensis]|uniref:Uncharacterized protein n=1 Tax=Muraenolepis orangiensis TaxID=630683 RepID=A0A9Q0DRF7_9TELE|nr:hypothetical protein NHX12_006991 [Muraenolepis orangiensis]